MRGTRSSHWPARPRVLVVDDHAAMLDYVALTLQQEFTVVGCMRDVSSLLDRWAAAHPDAIVLDISLGDGNGFEAAGRLRAAGCRAPIVFLSVHEEPDFVRAAWEAGGLGYVAKRDMWRALVPAVHAALRGKRYVSVAVESR